MKTPKTASNLQVPLAGLPSIRLAGRFPHDDRGFVVRYLGPFISLHFYSYSGVIRIGSRQYSFRPGDVTLSPAGVPTSYDLPAAGYHYCVHFTLPPTGRAPTAQLPLHLSLGLMRDIVSQKLSQVIQHQSRAHRSAAARTGAAAGLLELLIWLCHNQNESIPELAVRSRVDRALESAVLQLDQQLESSLSVPELAHSLELSQNYLAHHFRDRYGITLQRYLLLRRLELAQLLLTTTNLPVKTIGERVGMPDPQHFNKQFRRMVGLSPTRLRGMAASDQANWPRKWREIRQKLEPCDPM